MTDDYRERIDAADVSPLARQTPLMLAEKLSRTLGHQVYLKREELQPCFSFKIRGAFYKISRLEPATRARGVICASAGNHAQGVAMSARHFGCDALVVMPVTTPPVKVAAVKSYGGEVVLRGESYSDAYAHAMTLQQKHGLTFIHPFDDVEVITGQGTVARELHQQAAGMPLHAVFVPIGGGGLISGVAAYLKAVSPHTKVIGVQSVDSNAMALSRQTGERLMLTEVGLFSDGTAVKQVGVETLAVVRRYVDDILLVNSDAICAGILDAYNDTRMVLEPAGALSLAGLRQYADNHVGPKQNLVAITSGANMNFDRLRFVFERAEIAEAKEAIFAVTLPEVAGSFLRFCAVLGGSPITEFNYRISGSKEAHIFVGIGTKEKTDRGQLLAAFRDAGLRALDLGDDDLSKSHIRHLVGGKSPFAKGERLYRFEFPDRPGALVNFLTRMSPHWNVSLFHYRNDGGDVGRVLVGIQVGRDVDQLQTFLTSLGYFFVDETHNPAYQMFLAGSEEGERASAPSQG